MDIFVRDVCDALAAAGVPVQASRDPEESHVQALATEIVGLAGLPDQGTLYNQMRRRQDIKKTQDPDIHLEYTVSWPNRPGEDVPLL
jgi:hypothetical protein